MNRYHKLTDSRTFLKLGVAGAGLEAAVVSGVKIVEKWKEPPLITSHF
jgi:hypothetical protein